MGTYLNPSKKLFEQCYHSRIHVDKSMLIASLNEVLGTEQRYVFVSRPRRFGKSMAAKMLSAYYCKTCDSRALFDQLQIAEASSYETHLNQYDVIFLTMTDFLPEEDGESFVQNMKQGILADLEKQYGAVIDFSGQKLWQILMEIFNTFGTSFIFIIDEWDCIFRERKNDFAAHDAYLSFLRSLLKDKPYVELAYMTGILPIKKYVSDSTLNMFREYTMLNQRELASFAGFTEKEVQQLCQQYQMDFQQVNMWYDGYTTGGLSLYNPRSVCEAMLNQSLESYWIASGAAEALSTYLSVNQKGLREAVLQMLHGTPLKINTSSFQNDMISFHSRDDVLTLLVHLGYLTYDAEHKTAQIPNTEIRLQFYNLLETSNWDELLQLLQQSRKLLEHTIAMDDKAVAAALDVAHREYASVLAYNNENALSCAITMAYFAARGEYEFQRELPAGKGYADIVLIPNPGCDKPAMVIELKWNQSVEAAIAQIQSKGYIEGLKGYQGDVLLVGINYDKESKQHQCRIERYVKG